MSDGLVTALTVFAYVATAAVFVGLATLVFILWLARGSLRAMFRQSRESDENVERIERSIRAGARRSSGRFSL